MIGSNLFTDNHLSIICPIVVGLLFMRPQVAYMVVCIHAMPPTLAVSHELNTCYYMFDFLTQLHLVFPKHPHIFPSQKRFNHGKLLPDELLGISHHELTIINHQITIIHEPSNHHH